MFYVKQSNNYKEQIKILKNITGNNKKEFNKEKNIDNNIH